MTSQLFQRLYQKLSETKNFLSFTHIKVPWPNTVWADVVRGMQISYDLTEHIRNTFAPAVYVQFHFVVYCDVEIQCIVNLPVILHILGLKSFTISVKLWTQLYIHNSIVRIPLRAIQFTFVCNGIPLISHLIYNYWWQPLSRCFYLQLWLEKFYNFPFLTRQMCKCSDDKKLFMLY